MPKRGSWRCGCGAYNPAVKDVCESCGAIRAGQANSEGAGRPTCRDCQEASTWTHLTRGEDGEVRCASCHLALLKSRMAKPEDRCEDGTTVVFGLDGAVVVRARGITFVTTTERAPHLKELLARLPDALAGERGA